MSELMHSSAVNLSLNVPGKFDLGVHGDADIEDACRAVLNTFMDWLAEKDTETQLAAELQREQLHILDLAEARHQVREVIDVLRDVLERDVGRLS